MFNVLIDTCVWLDIAIDPKQASMIDTLEQMIQRSQLRLIVPEIVLAEFQRNMERVANKAQAGLKTHFKNVRDAINKVETNSKQKSSILKYLQDVDTKIPLQGGAAVGALLRLEQLLKRAQPIPTSDKAKLKALERGLSKRAPCHLDKNSAADAVIAETYFEQVLEGKAGERFAFVTHNKNDFSLQGGDHRKPHADLSFGFSRIKSLYFVSLRDCLLRIDPMLVADITFESTYQQEVRTFSEILDAENRLGLQVWYNRHKVRQAMIDRGEIRIVSKDEWEDAHDEGGYEATESLIGLAIWEGALATAAQVEKLLGPENIGPWDAFEWGMVNGKLSAIRWVLGNTWDFLDT